MDRRKIIRLIASVAIAFALWVYVINVVNPSSSKVIKNVPVQLTGTDVLYGNNLAIQGDGEYTVDVVISAPRTELSAISADNFVATGDVSALTMGQDYITVSVSAPNGVIVSDIHSRKIQVYVDELVKKTVDVQFQYDNVDDQHETTIVSANAYTVELSGAKSLMDQLGGYIVTIDNSLLKNETVTTLAVEGTAIDKSGNNLKGIVSSNTEISVSATIYSTKTVSLNVNYGGDVWSGVTLNKITAPDTIDIKGPVEALSIISEIYTEYIDIENIYEDYEETIVPYLPFGIYVCDNCKDYKLVADVAEEGKVEFDFYPYEIFVKNLSEGYTYETPELTDGDYITVSVQGDATILKTLSREDFSLYVNANGLTEGEHSLKIAVDTHTDDIKVTVSPSHVRLTIK